MDSADVFGSLERLQGGVNSGTSDERGETRQYQGVALRLAKTPYTRTPACQLSLYSLNVPGTF